jgi:hypothetical protein
VVNPTRVNHLLLKKKKKRKKKKKTKERNKIVSVVLGFPLPLFSPQIFFPPLSPTTNVQLYHHYSTLATTVQLRPPRNSANAHHPVNLPVCF